jgi:hypothetical protein
VGWGLYGAAIEEIGMKALKPAAGKLTRIAGPARRLGNRQRRTPPLMTLKIVAITVINGA